MLQGHRWLASHAVLCCSYVVCVYPKDTAVVLVAAVLLHPFVVQLRGSYL